MTASKGENNAKKIGVIINNKPYSIREVVIGLQNAGYEVKIIKKW